MIKHVLPGEIGETKWFDNLNKFQEQETIRQVKFKRMNWPTMEDGKWSKNKKYTYPHILPDNKLKLVFYPSISDSVIQYCEDNDISIHTEALNLKSSQVCCFNIMFVLKQDLNLAKSVLKPFLYNIKEVISIEFELTGGKDASSYLGEKESGKRGQNQTSIDLAIKWKSQDKTILTLCEWKYTEANFGICGGYNSKSSYNRDFCTNFSFNIDEIKNGCYLVAKHNRNYWDKLKTSGISLDNFSKLRQCPFKGPLYQVMRQFVLAHYFRTYCKDIDEVDVLSIGFKENKYLQNTPRYMKELGQSIIEVWNKSLMNAPQLKHINVEDIVKSMRDVNDVKLQNLLIYLEKRYGL